MTYGEFDVVPGPDGYRITNGGMPQTAAARGNVTVAKMDVAGVIIAGYAHSEAGNSARAGFVPSVKGTLEILVKQGAAHLSVRIAEALVKSGSYPQHVARHMHPQERDGSAEKQVLMYANAGD